MSSILLEESTTIAKLDQQSWEISIADVMEKIEIFFLTTAVNASWISTWTRGFRHPKLGSLEDKIYVVDA
jgi:hypothetical protein